MLPVIGSVTEGVYDATTENLWGKIEDSRLPIQYLANLFLLVKDVLLLFQF
jgi:nitrate reductase beta subunit